MSGPGTQPVRPGSGEPEHRLQQILDQSGALVFGKDLAGRYLFANRQFCSVVGKPLADILGRRDADVMAPPDAARFEANDRQVLATRRALSFEEQALFDGALRTYLVDKFPLLDPAGEPYAVCGIATDISERKRIEETLRVAALAVSGSHGETVFQELVRHLGRMLDVDWAFIAVRESEADCSMQIRALWDGRDIRENFAYRLAGTPCETVVGQCFRIYPDRLGERFPADTDFSDLGMESYAGYPMCDAQGRPLGLISVVSRRPLADAGFVESVLKIFATRATAELERDRMESALRQAQKMEAIGQLAGGIAHDFNNILTSIAGYLALAAEHPAAQGDPRLARYLAQARSAAGRAGGLIAQMLAFSRGRRGTPQPVEVTMIVDELSRLMAPMLPASITLSVAVVDDPGAVLADPVQLEQVLMNLCINARDALGGRGRIALHAAPPGFRHGVCASCRQPVAGRFIDVSVHDDGPGIAPAVRERMFDPFYTTKPPGKGSGMGLATVHGIVHEMGGHLLLESALGTGAVFHVLLPPLAARAEAAERSLPPGGRAGPSGLPGLPGRVLLVDDEPMIVDYLQELLASWGLAVTCASDGAAASQLFADAPGAFDLVLTDLTMPGAGGLDLARAIAALRPDVPVIILTGYAEGVDEAVWREAGARLLLHKPVDPAALRTGIEAALAGR